MSSHNGRNGSWSPEKSSKPTQPGTPENRGVMVVGTSALMALNTATGKREDNKPQAFTTVLPKLANEGVKVIIPQRVVDAVRGIILSQDGTSEAPVLKLLDDVEQGRLANMFVEPSDQVHDSYDATKAAVSKYAGAGERVYLLTNSIKSDPRKADRAGMMHVISREHPNVELATTTALLMDLGRTGVSHKFGVHSDHFEDLTSAWPARVRNDANLSPPIDISGRAYQTLEGTRSARSAGGPFAELLKEIAKTKSTRILAPREGYSGGLDKPESRVAAVSAGSTDGGDLPPLG